jgi:hypothetical protein
MATTRPALAALLTEALMTFSSSSRPVNAAASGGSVYLTPDEEAGNDRTGRVR